MIDFFNNHYGALPWFNQQLERSKQGIYPWAATAKRHASRHLDASKYEDFDWAILPTLKNKHYKSYIKGS